MTHKLTPVVLPMSKQGFQKEDLLKKANSIWLADINRDDDANGVKAQQLYLVSDRPPQNRELILRRYFPPTSGLTEKVCKYNPSVMDGHSVSIKRIEAAYPAIDGIPTISPADMQKFVERNGEVQWEMEMESKFVYLNGAEIPDSKFEPRIESGYIVLKEVEKVINIYHHEPKPDDWGKNNIVQQPDKTPLQMAIEMAKESADGYMDRSIINKILIGLVDSIETLLPAERQFAKKCFNAGEQKGTSDMAKSRTAPDFSTFYEKYEI